MLSAKINLKTLLAISLCVSKEETRYYLNGVCVEIAPRFVTYIATDGHRMAVHREELPDNAESNTLLGQFIIPSANCASIKLAKRADGDAILSGDSTRLTIEHGADAVSFAPIDGTFPAWHRVVPTRDASGIVAQFNATYLASLQKIGQMLGYGDMPQIAHDELNPALVTWPGHEETFCVIMPVRASGKPELPAWFTEFLRSDTARILKAA